MKQIKRFTVNDTDYKIVSDSFVMDLFSPGRGIIVVQADKPLAGITKYYLGYNDTYYLYMTGYVENCYQMDNKQQRLSIKELSFVLSKRMPITLRHVTAEQIIQKLSEISGVSFILEKADWNSVNIPSMINIGTGYEILDWLGKELRIKNYIWQCQPDGKLYVGSWAGSKLGNISMELPAKLLTQVSIVGATMPIIPQYRPGLNIKIGTNQKTFITSIDISSTDMRLKWNINPWEK